MSWLCCGYPRRHQWQHVRQQREATQPKTDIIWLWNYVNEASDYMANWQSNYWGESSKGKGKTHVNKQTKSVNNRTTGKTSMALTCYRHFQRNGGLNQILWRQTSTSITVKRFRLSLCIISPEEHHFHLRKTELSFGRYIAELVKGLYSDTKILSKNILSLQIR
jgi:hypothetical protein